MEITRKLAVILTVVMIGTVLPYNVIPAYALENNAILDSDLSYVNEDSLKEELISEEPQDALVVDDSNLVEENDYLVEEESNEQIALNETVKVYDAGIIETGSCGESLTWTFYSDGKLNISGTGDMTDYSCSDISIVDNKDPAPWKKYGDEITSISIENGITKIGDCAFSKLGGISEITLPDSLKELGDCAFGYCDNLQQVTIGTNIEGTCESVGGSSPGFYERIGSPFSFSPIKKVTFTFTENGKKTIRDDLFDLRCCCSIIDEAFEKKFYENYSGIEEIIIPEGIVAIGNNAFKSHISARKIEIPNSVEFIGVSAFAGESNLESVTIPNSVKGIGYCAFAECSNLSDVTIGVDCLDSMFGYSGDVVNVTYPFYKCQINHLTILDGNEGHMVYGCISDYFTNCVEDGQTGYYEGYIEVIDIENGIESIGSSAFCGFQNLRTIYLPESLTFISGDCLDDYSAEKIEIFYPGTRDDWDKLVQREYEKNPNAPLFKATLHLGDETLEFVDGVLQEGDNWALRWKCWYYLDSYTNAKSKPWLEIYMDGIDTSDSYKFSHNSKSNDINPWLSATGFGKTEFTKIKITGTVKNPIYVVTNQFSGYSGIKSLELDRVYGIGGNAFEDCASLEKIDRFDSSLRTIDTAAFKNDQKLYVILDNYMASNLGNIGNEAFSGTALNTITLNRSVKKIGDKSFEGCRNLVIRCYKDSVAHQYAMTNSIEYVLIDDEPYTATLEFGGDDFAFNNWSPRILLNSKPTINEDLAQMCLILSSRAYGDTAVKRIDEALLELNLVDDDEETLKANRVVTKNRWNSLYTGEAITPAHTFALRKYVYNKKTYNIITIIVRGSNNISDWINNISHNGITHEAVDIYEDLELFLKTNNINVTDENNKYLITGHSLGGAVANLLSYYIISQSLHCDGGVFADDITCYTYACPYTLWHYDRNTSGFGYSMNFIHPDDIVTDKSDDYVMVLTDALELANNFNPLKYIAEGLQIYKAKDYKSMRYGFDISLGSWINKSVHDRYTHYSGGKKIYELLNPIDQDIELHLCDMYMALIKDSVDKGTLGQKFAYAKANSGHVLSIYCPVDVNIIDKTSGKTVTSISNNKIVYSNDENIRLIVIGDQKYIKLPLESEYQIQLIGNDKGTMNYVIQDVEEDENGVYLTNAKRFDGVELTSGKTMENTIEITKDNLDIQLFIVDEDGKQVREIKEDGTEVDYSKYGDILPEDVPIDGKIPEGIWITGVEDKEYTGSKATQSFRVYDGMKLLNEKVDYTVSYKNNINVYTLADDAQGFDPKKAPSVTVTGKGNYDSTEVVYFKILPQDISKTDFTADDITLAATGKKQTIKPALYWKDKTLKNKLDYKFAIFNADDKSFANPLGQSVTDPSDYVLRFSGNGNFTGTRDIKLKLTSEGTLVSKLKVGKIPAAAWTGNPIKPEPEVFNGKNKLVKDTHYTLTYASNIDPGTGYVIITGNPDNGYVGSRRVSFKITAPKSAKAWAYDISEAKDTDKRINIDYSKTVPFMKGGAKPAVTVTFKTDDGKIKKLVEGRDYRVAYKNNAAYGGGKTPLVVVSGAGNFKGKRELPFAITEKNLSNVTLLADDKPYKNKANSYTTKVTLTDEDEKNLSSGKDYEKDIKYTYVYGTKVKINGTDVQRNAGDAVDKQDIIPADTVIRVTATAKAGSGYKGTVSGTYKIGVANISSSKVTIPTQVYTGKPITLSKDDISVVIKGNKLKSSDYEIVGYSDNINKGTAKVTIRGIGDYGGSKTQSFKIKAKGFRWWWRNK